jgi:hypothetical protein
VRRVKPQKRTPKSAQLASRAPVRAATEGSRDEELKGNSDQEIAINEVIAETLCGRLQL